jgi:hypothetical protein
MRKLSVISFKNLSRKNPTPAFELKPKPKTKPKPKPGALKERKKNTSFRLSLSLLI